MILCPICHHEATVGAMTEEEQRFYKSHKLELSVKLYNQNDQLPVHIENNEWISGDPIPWDLESSASTVRNTT